MCELEVESIRTAVMRGAAALNEHGLVANASAKARRWVMDQLRVADSTREDEIDAKPANNLARSEGATTAPMRSEITTGTAVAGTGPDKRDLDSYFVRAQRVLPDDSAP